MARLKESAGARLAVFARAVEVRTPLVDVAGVWVAMGVCRLRVREGEAACGRQEGAHIALAGSTSEARELRRPVVCRTLHSEAAKQ